MSWVVSSKIPYPLLCIHLTNSGEFRICCLSSSHVCPSIGVTSIASPNACQDLDPLLVLAPSLNPEVTLK